MNRRLVRPVVVETKPKTSPEQQRKVWALQEAHKFCSLPGAAKSLVDSYLRNNSLTEKQWAFVDKLLAKSFENMKDNPDGEVCRELIKNNYGV